jgi:hypothetical protein
MEYVKNQEEHHKEVLFKDKYIQLLLEYNIKLEENTCCGS